MTGIRELRKMLVRGVRVRVHDSGGPLSGERVFVKSEALAPCRGGARCAEDHKCNGYAVFVCETDPALLEDGAGWRKGATKLCLSHLTDDEGVALTKMTKAGARQLVEAEVEVEAEAEIGPEVETRNVTPSFADLPLEPLNVEVFSKIEAEGDPVSWVDLAHTAQAAQQGSVQAVAHLVLLARRLKSAEAGLQQRLIEAQSRLIGFYEAKIEPAPLGEEETEAEEEDTSEGLSFDPYADLEDSYTASTRDYPIV